MFWYLSEHIWCNCIYLCSA